MDCAVCDDEVDRDDRLAARHHNADPKCSDLCGEVILAPGSLHIDILIDAIMDNKKAAVEASNDSSGGDSGAGPQPIAEDTAQAQQLAQVQVLTIRVPTFAPPRQERASVEDINDLRSQDPFHYFSDPARRMAYLRYNEGNINLDNPQQQQQQAGERKTRISFEVYPSFL